MRRLIAQGAVPADHFVTRGRRGGWRAVRVDRFDEAVQRLQAAANAASGPPETRMARAEQERFEAERARLRVARALKNLMPAECDVILQQGVRALVIRLLGVAPGVASTLAELTGPREIERALDAAIRSAVEQARSDIRAKLEAEPTRSPKPAPGPDLSDPKVAKAERAHWRARWSEIQLGIERGDLVDVHEAEFAYKNIIRTCTTRLLQIPGRISHEFAANDDRASIYVNLDAAVREACHGLHLTIGTTELIPRNFVAGVVRSHRGTRSMIYGWLADSIKAHG